MPPRWIALDTMDTVIADPFFPMLEQDDDVGFLARQGWKNIEAWREFEAGRSSEEEYFARFYGDGVHDGRPHPSLLRDAMHAAAVLVAAITDVGSGISRKAICPARAAIVIAVSVIGNESPRLQAGNL